MLPHIVIIGDTIGLPNGFAATSRTKYLARAFQHAGSTVEVLLIKPSEYKNNPQNRDISGSFEGIPFHYTSGSAIHSTNWFARRFQEVRGLFSACREIRRIALEKPNTVVVAYTRHLSTLIAISQFARKYKTPVVLELCEWPTTQPTTGKIQKWRKELFCRHALDCSDGAIVISDFIQKKVVEIIAKTNRQFPTIKIPILGEADETGAIELMQFMEAPYFLYSGSLQYAQNIRYILSAFASIAGKYPKVKLIITGSTQNSALLASYKKQMEDLGITDRVVLTGFISRNALLTAYNRAMALLIPLFNDVLSSARFPTKLAEYLFAGRPVVTTSTGEVKNYLKDGRDAFVAENDSMAEFVRCLEQVISDPARAEEIAKNGKNRAIEIFDYRSCGVILQNGIKQIQTLKRAQT